MELDHLRYVVRLAKCLHFSKAASELGITQPSLSQRILQIENSLGVKLFERKTRSVCLTTAGEEFVIYAEKVLSSYDQLQEAMRKQSATNKGSLRIGTLLNMSHLALNAQVMAFQKEHPHIQLIISEIVGSFELVQKLEAESFDVVFFTPSPELKLTNKFETLTIQKGRVVAVLPNGHRLADKTVIELHELSEENLLFPARSHSLFSMVIAACRGSGFEPRIVAQSSRVDTAIELAAKGMGIALFSSQFVEVSDQKGVTVVPVEPVIPRNITLAFSRQTANLSAVKVFCDFIVGATRTRD